PVLAWRDVLHEGPVPPGDARTVNEARARFLAETGRDESADILDELERRDRRFLTALAEGREVVLWFEHDLYDQLQLLQVLALAGEAPRLELINVGAFEGRPDFHGLGELTAGELESLWPLRRPVTDGVLELARAAWDAF